MRIRYNAPVTLTFTIFTALLLTIDQLLHLGLIPAFFTVPGRGYFDFSNILSYLRLVTHAAGHQNWTHFMSNFAFILLLGPVLEEKHGSVSIAGMMLTTALVTGILNALFLSAGLMGASGIVFMMILLSSFTNIRKGEIPLTFLLIVILFLAKEVINSFQQNNISEFAHIIGGICGSLFGFSRGKSAKD
ncbi:MAG: rhomboid family intramembrane serine protease [Spirochaetes bacterium]|nr:MAG: rhomboid family intramembrane serine protease [Spirochaetota bacterium]